MVGLGGVPSSNTISIGSDGATLYVANRSDPDAALIPDFSASSPNPPSPAWNNDPNQGRSITVGIWGTAIQVRQESIDTWNAAGSDEEAQISTSSAGFLTVRADYPYTEVLGQYDALDGTNRLIAISVNGFDVNARVWRWAPIAVRGSNLNCVGGTPGRFSKPGQGGLDRFSFTVGGCGAGTFSGSSGAALAGGPSAGASSSTTSGNGSLITITGSLSSPGDGTRTTGNALGGPSGGAGASGRGGDGSGNVASSASDQDRASDVDAEQTGSPTDTAVSRCPRGASAEADLGRTASSQGAAPDVFTRCEEFTETRISDETTASRR
jgi:hypothetical protein